MKERLKVSKDNSNASEIMGTETWCIIVNNIFLSSIYIPVILCSGWIDLAIVYVTSALKYTHGKTDRRYCPGDPSLPGCIQGSLSIIEALFCVYSLCR